MNKTLLKLITYNDISLYHSFRFIRFTNEDLIYINSLKPLIFNYKQILKYQKLNNETIIKLFFDDDNQLANVSGFATRAKVHSIDYLDENYIIQNNIDIVYVLQNLMDSKIIHSEDFILKIIDLYDRNYIFFNCFNEKLIKQYENNKNIVIKLLQKDMSLFNLIKDPSEEIVNYYNLVTL